MNVTIVGNVCIDSNISEKTSYTSAGSPAMFMSKVFERLPNAKFLIMAPYGKDFLEYSKYVNLYPTSPTSDKTLIYENKSQGNKRSQKAYYTKNAGKLTLGDTEKDILGKTDVLYFAPLIPHFSTDLVREVVSASGDALKILLPQGFYRNFDTDNNVIQREFVEEKELLQLFDIVIVSVEDHDGMRRIVQRWSNNIQVVMTLGDKGAVYYDQGKEIMVKAEKANLEDIVDSVGSGDIFSACFGYKFSLSGDIKESISFANDIARQCLFYAPDEIWFSVPE